MVADELPTQPQEADEADDQQEDSTDPQLRDREPFHRTRALGQTPDGCSTASVTIVTRSPSTDMKPPSTVALARATLSAMYADLALGQHDQRGRVPRENPEIAVHGARGHAGRLTGPDLPVRGHQFHLQRHSSPPHDSIS